MEKTNRVIKQLTTLCLIIFFAAFIQSAAASDICPDEKTLSKNARIALVEAQKQMSENNLPAAKTILVEFNRAHSDENHPYVSYTLANLLAGENLLAPALEQYQKTVDMCPAYAPAWQNMGKICFDLEKFEQAAFAMEKAYEHMDKKDHRLLFHAAVAHVSAEMPENALAHMQFLTSGRAGNPEPDWVKLMVNLSIELKKEKQAIATVERLLGKTDPEPYLFRLATTLYLQTQKYRQAVTALSAYSLLSPLTTAEQTLLADLYNHQGIPFKAAQHYEKVLAHGPDKKLYERLTSAWLEAREPEKALKAAKKGLAAYPKFHSLWKLKGWIHYEEEAFKAASEAFSKAFALKKTDSRSLFMHGLCAAKAGQHDIAKKVLKEASSHSQYKQQALALIRQMQTEQETANL